MLKCSVSFSWYLLFKRTVVYKHPGAYHFGRLVTSSAYKKTGCTTVMCIKNVMCITVDHANVMCIKKDVMYSSRPTMMCSN